jgi:hypothetical protein
VNPRISDTGLPEVAAWEYRPGIFYISWYQISSGPLIVWNIWQLGERANAPDDP